MRLTKYHSDRVNLRIPQQFNKKVYTYNSSTEVVPRNITTIFIPVDAHNKEMGPRKTKPYLKVHMKDNANVISKMKK